MNLYGATEPHHSSHKESLLIEGYPSMGFCEKGSTQAKRNDRKGNSFLFPPFLERQHWAPMGSSHTSCHRDA